MKPIAYLFQAEIMESIEVASKLRGNWGPPTRNPNPNWGFKPHCAARLQAVDPQSSEHPSSISSQAHALDLVQSEPRPLVRPPSVASTLAEA